MVLRKTVSREQLLSNSRAWRTTSRRTTSHQRLARTAQTNLESLLLERLLLHLCVLARAHRRKGSLPRLCGERVLLRVIDTVRPSGLVYPHQIRRRTSTHAVSRNTPRKECRYRLLHSHVCTDNPLQTTQCICAVVIAHMGYTHLFREKRRYTRTQSSRELWK